MASIRRTGLLGGGLVAGAVLVASGLALGRLVLLPELAPSAAERAAIDVLTPLAARFALGFVLVWVYVGFRPRFGAGRRASILAAISVWSVAAVVVVSLAALRPLLSGLTVGLVVVWMLIELTAASFAGAAVYRRAVAASTRRRGRKLDPVDADAS